MSPVLTRMRKAQTFLKEMGNCSVTSANEQNLTELASCPKFINHTIRELKLDVRALQSSSPTESEAPPQKRQKLKEEQCSPVRCETDTDDEMKVLEVGASEAPTGDTQEFEWSEISDYSEANLETGVDIRPDFATLANTVLRGKAKERGKQ